ncbi:MULTISPECIES: isochorismate synthase [Rhodococcus]|uniref:isochorismate synthase n=1 Tax=Nocardia globerula TaxID=1818 RepID=A0A652YL30_NOCGL|nr:MULTISPECIES: isochorismate synthase [Rhodococcus]NMD61791.1 isochorismate synthase [Nocardia globerula]MDV8067900.1 isochorismate synthase [Rhodococcus sp. IEGM 1366]PVX66131.1 isochorismate synthase [Rhodococcus globerulus]QXW02726.1 isochorismate synthase [Rhodococcus globerulus]ROZ46226.1 isochorismate synthase [Rhodococcus sp. WS3]
MFALAEVAEYPLHTNRSDNGADSVFLLSRRQTSVQTSGVVEEFDSAFDAVEGLKTGRIDSVVGALPFAPSTPCALTAPLSFTRTRGDLHHSGAVNLPSAKVAGCEPSPLEHTRRVRGAITRLQAGELDKVVLARTLAIATESPISPTALTRKLISLDHSHNGFCVDLSPAGGKYRGRALVGSTPEVLIERRGDIVTCHPLAGSIARHPDSKQDEAHAQELLASTKDLSEHKFVVDSISAVLGPLCRSFSAPSTPELLRTPQLWHLGTKIEGVLADPNTTALELALALHPTPAICGTPTDAARDHITGTEDDRGFYAGAIGWCDRTGDGEWMVAIRCAEIAADGLSAKAYAGGGIVASSDPDTELRETSTKFRTILSAFDLAEDLAE